MEGNKYRIWLGIAIAFLIGWGSSYIYHTKELKIEDKFSGKNYEFASPQELECKNPTAKFESENTTNAEGVPNYVLETLEYVSEHKEAPAGYVGGRKFQNREGLLPRGPSYQEWDVHEKEEGKNRGTERLITSDEGSAYFTSDHYKSFTKIK